MRRNPVIKLTSSDLRASIWAKSDGHCWYCGIRMNPWGDFSIDHFVPTSKGGKNTKENLVPCCRRCNTRKGALDIEELRWRTKGRTDDRPVFAFECEPWGEGFDPGEEYQPATCGNVAVAEVLGGIGVYIPICLACLHQRSLEVIRTARQLDRFDLDCTF